jgi:hypothetical protein
VGSDPVTQAGELTMAIEQGVAAALAGNVAVVDVRVAGPARLRSD